MSNTARPADRKTSAPASQFKKVLQAFANGDLPYSDVQSHLQRLLTGGAAPEELREVLRRYESLEPLPGTAHEEILRVLTEAGIRPVAPHADSGSVRSQPQDTAPGSIPPEPIAAMGETRVLPSSAAPPRPLPIRANALGDAAASAENVSSIEDRIARQKADYKALNIAYERVRDAGSAASARTVALAAEIAAIRGALESEQEKNRAADNALSEAIALAEAARARGEETRRELERVQKELRSVRELAAARDTTIGELRLSLEERESQLAALQADHAARMAAMGERTSAGARLEADFQAERARSTTLAAELADVRTALESAQVKIREANQALSEKLPFADAARREAAAARSEVEASRKEADAARKEAGAARSEVEAARKEAGAARSEVEAARKDADAARNEELRKSQRHQVELSALRDSLATLRARMEAELQASRAHATALATELASTRAALESEHSKSLETRKALAERVAAEEAAQSQGEDALRKLDGYRAELSKARDLLAARQEEHARIVGAVEARTEVLEARLQAAETRLETAKAESSAGHEITVAIAPPRVRGAVQAAVPPWDLIAAPITAPVEVRERGPIVAVKSARRAQFSEFPMFGSRGPGRVRLAQFVWVSAALAVVAAVVWVFMRQAPVAQHNVPAAVTAEAPEPGSVIRDCATCPALTVVPAGRFKQGSNRTDGNSAAFERPPHWVLFGRPFAISTNAVTVDEFRPFAAATGREMHGCDTYEDKWRFRPDASWESPGFTQTGSHPVTCVSWDDAKAYAGWLTKTTGHRYRLPSAAEWEYAARAGGEALRPWNSDGSGACASANVADQRAARRYPGWAVFPCDDGYVYTAPVGSFKANAFGLNDMLGNVFQWTDDCWHADYAGVPTDGSSRTYGDCSERELRGGSWFTNPDFVRASYRNHFGVNYRASSVGIRLVRDIGP